MSAFDHEASIVHEATSQSTDDIKITTLENAVPHLTQDEEKGSAQAHSPVQAANETLIIQKNKLVPKKRTLRSNISKSKVKRKPLLIPTYVTVSDSTPKYTCTICNKSFTTRLHVRYHSYCDGLSKPFKCEKCDQEFITKSHYQYHVRNHEGNRPYPCLKCGKSFNQQGKLTRHSRSHLDEKSFVCSTCGHRFKNLDGLKSHAKIHTGVKAHHCTLCSKTFAELANLKKHLVTHKGEKNFMCDECGKSFSSKSTLNTHIQTHSKTRPHVCNACGRAFSLRKDLKRHETIHLSMKPFECQLCKLSFRRRDNFDRHMKNTHPDSSLPPIIQPLPKVPSKESLPIQSSDKQPYPNSEPKNIITPKGCISENVKKDAISSEMESNRDLRSPIKNNPNEPDDKDKNLSSFHSHSTDNESQPDTAKRKLSAENDSNTIKPDVGIESGTQKDTTSKTVSTNLMNDSPPRSTVFQAVPVINRTTVHSPNQHQNVATSSIIKMGSSLARAPHDGTNCVRTITCTSNVQRAMLPPSPSHHPVETAVNVKPPETCANTDKTPVDQHRSNQNDLKQDSTSSDCPPKPKLRLYLSDLHWRKRAMELLNLRNELKADSLVYDKSLEKVADIEEEKELINPVTHSERIEFCNSPKNNNPDDHGTYYSKQVFYKVSDQPGEFLLKGTQQKYLPHNRLRHIHPKSIDYHDPRQQTGVYQRTISAEPIGSTSGVVMRLPVTHTGSNMQHQHQHATTFQPKNVIVENKIENVRPSASQ